MDLYNQILNKNTGQQFYTGIVSTLDPFTAKLFTDDTAISVVATNNLHGITASSKLILAKIDNQFFAVGIIQDSPYPIGWKSYIRKDSDTQITNDNSLNNDPALVITVPKNGIYKFSSNLFVDSASVNPGFQWKYVLTDVTELSARAVHSIGKYDASNDYYSMDEVCMAYIAFDSASNTISTAQYGYHAIIESGLIETGNDNGTVQLQWAQVTSHADQVTMKADSWIMIEKINNN